MSQGGIKTPDDRREYFRVNDSVRLHIRKVPKEHLEDLLERLEQNITENFTVMTSLAAINSEMAVSMRRIENNDPDVAAYLKALDRKIDVLGKAYIASESDLIAEQAHAINLSAGGMSMLVNESYLPGDPVEIKMLLFPSFTGVLTYGTVIDCSPAEMQPDQPAADYGHHIRIEFTHLREQDRDILIRHVLRCQSTELRRRDPAHREGS